MDDVLKKQVIERLQQIPRKQDRAVVLLPDFFVDHFVVYDSWAHFVSQADQKRLQGGGNIPGVAQSISQGGNAANTALALARLGIASYLICRTDPLGYHLLDFFLGKHGVDLSHVKTDGKIALTTALEFQKDAANVMLGDPGSVADFSFSLLDENDLALIKQCSMVCVVNWNLNAYGTSLASEVFSYAKKEGVTTFFDCGDPSPRLQDLSHLMKHVVTSHNLDIFGLNENEFMHLSKLKKAQQEDILRAAKMFKQHISARLDIHTADFSCSYGDSFTCVPVLSVPTIYRLTGAGDAWNAGDIFAELHGFSAQERLFFANAYAGYYISSKTPHHADIEEILQFLQQI
ncbi:MAG: PfkB family carbohydrate kinase [Candidatus Thermoplasmatota archaeon]